MANNPNDDVVLWGAAAIGAQINRNPRQAYALLETGKIPGTKIGKLWTSTPRRLREHFADSAKTTLVAAE